MLINMPLRETAVPNCAPNGLALLASRLELYDVRVTIVDLNVYRIKDAIATARGLKNGRHLTILEVRQLIERYLALDPEVNLTDVQLIQMRTALRSSYRDQLKMREEMRGGGAGEGDPQRLREEMAAMREGLMKVVKANLTEAQYATFSAAQERLQGSRGQGGGRRGGGGAQ